MYTRQAPIIVCHISPLGNTKGGISTVVGNYREVEDWPVRLLFVESHRDGTAYQKFVCMIAALWRACLICLTRKVDIVQIHVGDFPSIYRKMLVSVPFFASGRARKILHMHGAAFLAQYERQPAVGRWLVRRFIQKFDSVIALSESWREVLESQFKISHLLVLSNAVAVPTDLPLRDFSAPRKFLFLGLIGTRKGIFDLLKAAQIVAERGESFVLRVGGNGDIDKLHSAIQTQKLEGVVDYLGWVTGSARDDIMKCSDVLVLPSYAEGAPMSIIEGMAAGLPIISTRVGAIPEMIDNSVSGFVIEPGDVSSLAEAMIRMCRDDALCRQMSEAAHDKASRDFSLNHHKQKLLNTYDALLKGA